MCRDLRLDFVTTVVTHCPGETLSGVRKTVACAGARRSSELGFELVTDAQKMHPFTGQHAICQSFIEPKSFKMKGGPQNSSHAKCEKSSGVGERYSPTTVQASRPE